MNLQILKKNQFFSCVPYYVRKFRYSENINTTLCIRFCFVGRAVILCPLSVGPDCCKRTTPYVSIKFGFDYAVAARVISRDKHELLKTSLQLRYVSESIEEEHEKNKLFLRNIPSGVDEEYLQLFLEKQLQLSDDDFGKTVLGDVAVITFTKECTVNGK